MILIIEKYLGYRDIGLIELVKEIASINKYHPDYTKEIALRKLRWAIGVFFEFLILECFAHQPEADHHFRYYWRKRM